MTQYEEEEGRIGGRDYFITVRAVRFMRRVGFEFSALLEKDTFRISGVEATPSKALAVARRALMRRVEYLDS